MKYLYDLHIHSALSPCADDDMSPVMIVAQASALGLEIIAISDHNAIGNVQVAMSVGEMLDVLVIPAMELQTSEDLHLLCLFPSFETLKGCFAEIPFLPFENDKSAFGNQLLYNDDDEVIGEEKSLLATSCLISEYEARELVDKWEGVAVPAHIERDSFGMYNILGGIPEEYTTVESERPLDDFVFGSVFENRRVIKDSDAHTLADIGKQKAQLELPEKTAAALLSFLRNK